MIEAIMAQSENYEDAVALLRVNTGESRTKAGLAIRYAHEALAIPFGANTGPQATLGINTNFA